MPLYDYLCSACEARLEAWQKMNDAPLSECPACGKPTLRKLMSSPAIRVGEGRKAAEPACGAGACPACIE